jgi:DMSO/TMAO reductase YedYZ molybdopterin-dependent catalytic subunit
MNEPINRRELLYGASLLAAHLGTARTAWAALQTAPAPETPRTAAGLLVRSAEPINLEMPFASLRDFLVPNEQFYVRNHFAQPRLEAREWRLRVEGLVKQPLELTYDEVRKLATRSVPALLECAGNNRAYLSPKAKGVQWEQGAVGTAEWTGVPLKALLQRAGLRSGATDVVFEGADEGEVADLAGPIHFARAVPLEKAQRDVLLAHQMNGKELPTSHGYPLRAIVPGWYGVSSVKWLTRIVVTDQPFRGFFQSVDYTYWDRPYGVPIQHPITELSVKAQIARPAGQEVVPAGKPYRIFGAAWTGEADVERVEVSTDGGRSWSAARLTGKPVRHAWRLWEYDWAVPARGGRYSVIARATDSKGRQQPTERSKDLRNYMITHPVPVEVEVRAV